MEKKFKPAGYNSLSPYLIVEDAQKTIDLLSKVFDATQLRIYHLPDGKIMHAEIRIDDSVVMIADSSEQYPPIKLILHVYVPDVDATFAKAIAAGCEALEPPTQKGNDPDRRGTFVDVGGNYWSIGTQQ